MRAGLQKHAAAKDLRIVKALSASAAERYLDFMQHVPDDRAARAAVDGGVIPGRLAGDRQPHPQTAVAEVAPGALSARPSLLDPDQWLASHAATNVVDGGQNMTTTRQTTCCKWKAGAAGTIALLAVAVGANVAAQQWMRTGGTMTEQNKAVALRWSQELWSKGHLAVADEIVAPDYVRHDPGDPFPARGPADVKRIVGMLRSMLPDLRISVDAVIAEGDFVVSRYTATATDTVGYMGMPPTGKTLRTPAIQIFRFSNGKIVESWAARDDLGTLRQLGQLPARGGPAQR